MHCIKTSFIKLNCHVFQFSNKIYNGIKIVGKLPDKPVFVLLLFEYFQISQFIIKN